MSGYRVKGTGRSDSQGTVHWIEREVIDGAPYYHVVVDDPAMGETIVESYATMREARIRRDRECGR